jgi:hypothetical protein
MTMKKPTVTSLKRDVASLTDQAAKLTKDLAQANSMKDMYSKNADEAKKELESLHSLIDVLPGALARKTVPNPEEHWNVVTHTLMTRFAAYLATRVNSF